MVLEWKTSHRGSCEGVEITMIEYTVKVWNNGSKEWWLNGERHREDGPAVELADGTREWFLNGKRHCEDGPAIEWSNGSKEWYLNGKLVTKKYVMGLKVEELTIAEISERLGYEVKVVKDDD